MATRRGHAAREDSPRALAFAHHKRDRLCDHPAAAGDPESPCPEGYRPEPPSGLFRDFSRWRGCVRDHTSSNARRRARPAGAGHPVDRRDQRSPRRGLSEKRPRRSGPARGLREQSARGTRVGRRRGPADRLRRHVSGRHRSNLSEGALVVDAYNAMGYAAEAVGNHDFDFGSVDSPAARQLPGDPRGALKARAAQARYPSSRRT